MAHLFSKLVISDALKNLQVTDIESKISILRDWLDMYNSGSLQKKSEKEFEGVYNESLFGTILEYTSASNEEYTREKEPRNDSNGQKCDIGLGWYSTDSSITQAVVELKDAGTSLDRPQQRAGNLTPVQQAFKYKPLYNSKWVIVSNFFEIRLYTDTYKDFESFTLSELTDSKNDYENFRRFYAIFHASRLISKIGESETEKLLAKVRIEEEKISKEFYKKYKNLREELMRDIWSRNSHMQNPDVIEKAQRIIDRIVFICFCEDRGLLPQNKLKENIIRAKESDFTPWEVLKKFFQGIDRGSEKLGIPDGYNGGLFRADANIDSLDISDDIIEKFIDLGDYDFSEDGGQLSVEILGHIFEQSISDIEEIRTQIENHGKVEEEKIIESKVSKRKKDGIFYTPAYIVEYIVENSLGKYMSEHEEALKKKYRLKEDINEKRYRKREIEAYTEYQKILQNVKVLDPACGSGAFLVRVFDWLFAENKRVANILYTEGDQIKLGDDTDSFREILRSNIYGVDLNEESVEITKLSLWLKSAVRGKKLVTLDANIKCGNSLIDDPAVAGDKAFDWNEEFAEIMASGGFDVIVGNPPYIEIQKLNPKDVKFLRERYKSAKIKNIDIYIVFYERGLTLLRENGILSYITPNRFLNSEYGELLLKFLGDYNIFKVLNFKHYLVFEQADTYTVVLSIQNNQQADNLEYLELKGVYRGEDEMVDMFIKNPENVYNISSSFKENKIWYLMSDEERLIFNKNNLLPKLEQYTDEFFVGIQTSYDDFYILSFIKDTTSGEALFYSKYLNGNIELEKGLMLEIISNSNIKNYSIESDSDFILFPYSEGKLLELDFIKSKFPKAYKYFELGRTDLENREKGSFRDQYFYRYGRTQNVDKQDYKKLLIPHVTKTMRCAFDESGKYAMKNVGVNGVVLSEKYTNDYKFFLCLLNSNLLAFMLSKISIFLSGGFYASNKQFAEKLPIAYTKNQQPFIDRADTMLALNNELHEKSASFLSNISAKYKIEKVTRKIEKWWELDFTEFVKELKAKLSLEEQEELMAYFDKRKTEVRDIAAKIEATDKEIDDMVFDLYGLTEEERKVVLESKQNKQ